MEPDLPLVLTVEEAAAALRISRGSAYEAIRTGDLPHVRIGRTIRVPRHALLSLLGEGVAEDGSATGVRPSQHVQEAVRADGRSGVSE